ncbi:MAG: hypothetical protein JBO36_04970 [Candidatus Thiodiazotropha taylori]|nr:hypothetical protein [Candidatus Thiodiazotropha taylori]
MTKNRKGRTGCNQSAHESSENTIDFTGYAALRKVAVGIPELLILVPVDTPRHMGDFSNLVLAAVWRWA